jgi:cobalamin synthase
MNTRELPVVFSTDDHERVQRILADLRESANGSGTISVFLPVSMQVIVLLAHDGEIVSWCLMPAGDQLRAHALTALLRDVLSHELEIVCRDVKALADAAISRASQMA